MDNKESIPSSDDVFIGTPMTGNEVSEATIPAAHI